MLAIVYFCKGQIKGYVHNHIHVVDADKSKDELRDFYRNYILEGLKAPDNPIPRDGIWSAVIFDHHGIPVFAYHVDEGDFHVEPYADGG